jgi:hypothetical protein
MPENTPTSHTDAITPDEREELAASAPVILQALEEGAVFIGGKGTSYLT